MFRLGFSKNLIKTAVSAALINTQAIVQNISKKNLFDAKAVESTVNEYFKLGFDPSYDKNFTENYISDHVYGYLCAQAQAKVGSQFEHVTISDHYSFFFCKDTQQVATLSKIDNLIKEKKDMMKTHAMSIQSYHSKDGGVVLFVVEFAPFRNPEPSKQIAEHGFPTMDIVSTDKFIEGRTDESKARYEDFIKRMHESFNPVHYTVNSKGEEVVLSMAFKADRPSYFLDICAVLNELPKAQIHKKFMESFSNGVHVYTLYLTGVSVEDVEGKADLISQMPSRTNDAITQLTHNSLITAEESLYANCIMTFAFYFTPAAESEDYMRLREVVEKDQMGLFRLNSLRNGLSQEIRSESHLAEVIAENVDLIKKFYADFKKGSTAESRKQLENEVCSTYDNDAQTRTIMLSFLRFNASVAKHNFYKRHKAAFAFRLRPEEFFSKLELPKTPHGVFFFLAPHWRGFHIRIIDIARGGVRMILSDPRRYKNNKVTLFEENYNLAYTQLLKNKDIPEGGSKGTILVSKRILSRINDKDKVDFFQQYVDALLDVILPKQTGVIDNLKQQEIIFLGPDENTAGNFPCIGALHAKERGFKYWKCFTTGKEPNLGGIPHDKYGMTTRSVRQCVEGVYRKLGLDGSKLTKFMTGGPDGDLGSNEIKFGNEKVVGVVDGSGVLYDPEGINKEELVRLAEKRVPIVNFDLKKIGKNGFFVKADKKRDESNEKPIVLPDGTKVEKTIEFRDNFHFSKYLKTDVFVPCGGRPKSITIDNVHKLVYNHPNITGEMMYRGIGVNEVKPDDLKYKIIVEGANLFITNDARLALENCGVVLIKDSTANKGGVTSSSIEVLSGLALTDEEYDSLMCEKNGKLPEFYQNLVKEIIAFIESKAKREFELIWDTSLKHPNMKKTEISDILSRKIAEIRQYVMKSNLFEDKVFVRYILQSYTPKTILNKVPIDTLMKRIPVNYQKAILAVFISSDYVYTKGIESNEFDFYEFMKEHRDKAVKAQ